MTRSTPTSETPERDSNVSFRLRHALQEWWQDNRWFVIAGLWAVALILGYVGFARHFVARGQRRSPATLLYLTLQLFTIESGAVSGPVDWPLEVARWLAPAVAAYTALQTLALIFQEQVQLTRLRFFRKHTIICGLGRKGFRLAQGFRRRGEQVVVIEQDEEDDLVEPARASGIVVLSGSATHSGLLRRARVHTARRLISVCGDDGVNAEVGIRSAQLAADRKNIPLSCVLHITNPQLCALLREREIESGRIDRFRLEFFNVYDTGARAILEEYPAFDQPSTRHPHILLVGLGQLGENVLVQMAKRWSARHWASDQRFRVTIVDREAERKIESLKLRYPRLNEACEIVWKAVDVRGPALQRADFLFDARGSCDVTIMYVFLDDDSLGLSTALTLRQQVPGQSIPIVVGMEEDMGLARLVEGMHPRDQGFENLHAFGLLDRTCTPAQLLAGTHERIARAVHQVYLSCQSEPTSASVVWDELPEDYRESCRRQADSVGEKLRAVGCALAQLSDWNAEPLQFTRDEVETLAKMEHKRWMEEKRRDGWTRGPRDNEQKTNPYLVPWERLPEETKDVNRQMVRVLPASLAKVGLQVYRAE